MTSQPKGFTSTEHPTTLQLSTCNTKPSFCPQTSSLPPICLSLPAVSLHADLPTKIDFCHCPGPQVCQWISLISSPFRIPFFSFFHLSSFLHPHRLCLSPQLKSSSHTISYLQAWVSSLSLCCNSLTFYKWWNQAKPRKFSDVSMATGCVIGKARLKCEFSASKFYILCLTFL